jgi:ribosomal protein S30
LKNSGGKSTRKIPAKKEKNIINCGNLLGKSTRKIPAKKEKNI